MCAQNSMIRLAKFLVEAKRSTYAGLSDNATVTNPLLAGSKQLEWRDKDGFYRDIYYGMTSFTGMEVLYFKDKPIWSMGYSGGTYVDVKIEEAETIYAFLRSALMKVSRKFPVRGPSTFSVSDLTYNMTSHGGLESFWGREEVSTNGICRYALTFTGGLIH